MMKKVVSGFVTLTLLAGGAFAYATSRPDREFYTVSADIEQAPNLFAGGRVMVRGVEVGEISDVAPQPDGVRVTMEIEDGIKIPAGAELAVVPITVISDRYVQFSPAYSGGAVLEDGDHLLASRTSIPAELDDVLKQLKQLLATIEPKDDEKRGPLAKLIRDVDYIVKGNTFKIQGSLRHSASFLKNLADSSAEISGLIRNLDELFVTLAGRSSEIGLVNERFRLVAESLRDDRANLEGTIENITRLSKEARKLFRDSGDDLGDALGKTATVVNEVLEHQDAIAEGFRWTNVIAEALGATDRSGRGRFAYTGLQAPPGSLGAEYNYRLDTRDTIACERMDVLAARFQFLFPEWTSREVADAILSFIPEEYQDDIEYLILQLLPPCTGLPLGDSLSARASNAVRTALADAGREEFRAAVGIWLLQTVADGTPIRSSTKVDKR